MNCPICNKSGLPDYYNVPTVCPQCNSDLKAYLLLNNLSDKEKQTRTKWRILIISCSTILLLAIILFATFHRVEKEKPVLSATNDSVYYLGKINSLEQKIKSDSLKHSFFKYRIKRGDNLSAISYKFYNDWSKFKIIQEDNGLSSNYQLKIGDTLIIRLNLTK
jgi:hypothetical protein